MLGFSSFKVRTVSLCCGVLLAPLALAQTIQLQHGTTNIQLDPATLALNWANGVTKVEVNQANLTVAGQAPRVEQLVQPHATMATWVLAPSQIRVQASLEEDTLSLTFDASQSPSIARGKGMDLAWFDLPEAACKTLYLPFNEGMRVPTDNALWQGYLAEEYSGSNTSQDLKMPFWTQALQPSDSAEALVYLHTLLVNPYNNRLNFDQYDNKIDMRASHRFTQLNQSQAFEVQLRLGGGELSAAKWYRQWREDQGEAVSLAQKGQQQPAIAGLIGASHVYLFGDELLASEDVLDWWALKQWYFGTSELSQFVSLEAEQELAALQPAQGQMNGYQKQTLIEQINQSLNQLLTVQGSPDDRDYIDQQYQAAQARKTYLSKANTGFLVPADRWGQAMSQAMIDNLQAAGLTKLWLGLNSWMPAFYQPQAVEQAKTAGYLVASYDSYNTAIPAGVNDSWLTAHIAQDVRQQCAIEQVDGSKKKGFGNNGFYLNPACGREYVRNRIQKIAQYGHFNSLFLDADATGMVREDYTLRATSLSTGDVSKGKSAMDEASMGKAFNERMQWASQTQNLVIGSEDGNGITSSGLAFAHGMESVGFGWRDPDMKRNKQSPYYLGAWYPNHKPAIFFKAAKVKSPYKELFFSPQFSLPLYQTVLHNELVSSHHWLSDSVKFTNVQAVRDLTSMLYNTPAMVHLSRDTANQPNSPRLQALKHYQQGFQPMHQVLWNQTLEDFSWLSSDGLVQQTTFSDGSRIIANFSTSERTLSLEEAEKTTGKTIAPLSVIALLKDQASVYWRSPAGPK